MRILLALLLLCTLAFQVPAQRTRRDSRSAADVYAVVAEVDRIAARTTLWPGFDPRRIPVAIYDGQTTLLFRHPAPPAEFVSLSSRQGVWAFNGRHDAVAANAPVKLGGVWTATVLLNPASKLSLTERAALVTHELFHVHQREHHPKWAGNELELFTYPFDDAEQLARRRIETEYLRLAERATDNALAACLTRRALGARRERFARLTAGAVSYERALELNEGLARYVEGRATGARHSDLTAAEFPAEELRTRGYASGHALALLLERFAPGWSKRLEEGDTASLDELLSAALDATHPPVPNKLAACVLPQPFTDAARSRAKLETDNISARRETLRREFAARTGWRIVVNADTNAPLWPQDFDPLNVRRIGANEVLHTRHLKLGNDAGAIDSFHPHMLTTGAGAHPLFNGVRQLTVAGLSAEPVVREAEGKLTLEGAGIKAEFRGAQLERTGQTFTVNLQAKQK
ncbi:MAG TPA: hypothetical protein VGW12_07065 [Pyrinomonadaceae bacterium]|nr:hypothetical protein [Pyrinomonadaceae bacterium]